MKHLTGIRKNFIYFRIAIHVVFKYLFKVAPWKYPKFLRRALVLLLNFHHNKIVKVFNGYKLQLYLPAYPSSAFFYALENKLLKTPPSPVTVVFSMTKACSYKCPHCYQMNDKGSDLEESMLIETLLKVRDKGVAMFDIEGGEPFLRFERLHNLIKVLDKRSEIWVNTTGAEVSEDKLLALKKNGLFGLMISIHSPDSHIHDAFTGIKGSFDVACNTIKLCKQLGLVAAINSVLSEDEIKNGKLDDLMKLSREYHADFVQLIHPKPSGRWLNKKDHMQKEKSFIFEIEQAHLLYNSKDKLDYPSLAAQVFEERKEGLGCTAGAVDRFYINAAGEVQPCEFLNISFGNVNEEDFEILFKRMRFYFQEPCNNWLCCTQAENISDLMIKHNLESTPVPWKYTQGLVDNWDRGSITKLY
ncbi:MAG: radical SAM protein, partial [Candidatus Heimdallarchaeota archaeon]|nr:radical SAM protein [Candidatus Heimdallarchaeota archaeon]